jgi:hypothetical protein
MANTNTMQVKLDTSNGINKLDVVDNGGQNQVSQDSQPTTITWNLTGVLTQGDFVAMDCDPPGFQFVGLDRPAQGAFGAASVQSNGNAMQITDNHYNSSTNGTYVYQLRVNYQGQVLSTQVSLPSGTATNPAIINK